MYRYIHVAVQTAHVRNAGSNSEIVLILSQNYHDLLHHTFHIEDGLAAGSTHLLSVDVFNRHISQNYWDHIRLGIRGADAWQPQSVFVWGELDAESGGGLRPLALKVYNHEQLSTDPEEGVLSIPLNQAFEGGTYTQMNRVVTILQADKEKSAGTKSGLQLRMANSEGEFAKFVLSGSDDLKAGALLMHTAHVNTIFRMSDLRSIDMDILGGDQFAPEKIMIFGLDTRNGDHEYMVPMVFIPDWSKSGLGKLTTDEGEAGSASVNLLRSFRA